ncbi:MAG TPA: response regulator [Chitinophagaceae bacterium]|nr:response regulator [Chitinophagaceae bacterium]
MTQLKILIIDDEIDSCMIMKSFLEGKSHKVLLGQTIKECLQFLKESPPDILLLDNNLPDGKGWDLTESLMKEYPSLRIFLISAYHQKSDPLPLHGNVTVWEKPISLSLLNRTFGNGSL